MVEHRLRLTDDELGFLIDRLDETLDGYYKEKNAFHLAKRMHKNDRDRAEFDKANQGFSAKARMIAAIEDLMRRFQCIREGGRPRANQGANMCLRWVYGDQQKLEAEARKIEEAKLAEEAKEREDLYARVEARREAEKKEAEKKKAENPIIVHTKIYNEFTEEEVDLKTEVKENEQEETKESS